MVETSLLMFGRYAVDRENEQLRLDNQPVRLTNKAFAVLHHLVEHPGQLVTKEALFAAVWSETIVSETALTNCIGELRHALRDNPKQPRFIETVHRRGYRFIAPLTTSPHSSVESRVQGPVAKGQKGDSPLPTLDAQRQTLGVPLVGREAELTRLQQLFTKAVTGEREIVFVTGEAGIGKTALVDTFLRGIREQETRNSSATPTDPQSPTPAPWIAWGQCVEHYGAGEAYLPILEALGRLGRGPHTTPLLAVLRQYAPTWLVQLPALLSAVELEAVQQQTQGVTRERMLREITEAFEVLSAAQPLVFVLEDLHWSDPSTVEFLAMLARRREPACLLVVGTYRAAELAVGNHQLKTVKQELVARRQATEIALSFLSPAAVREYVGQRVVAAESIDFLADVVYRRTDGQPLFMVQVTEYLLQQFGLAELATVDPRALRIPQELRELIEAQLGRLTEEERHALEVGSVVGAEFTTASVAAGMTIGETLIEEICEGLARRGQFIESHGLMMWPDGTVSACYAFRHALYQEILYARIPEARRMRLHRMIGERIEGGYNAKANEIAAELAAHFEQGRDYQRAVHYRHQAGANALRRSAHREAISHLRQGLELIGSLPATSERSRLELTFQMTLGPALIATAGYAASAVARTYTRARELCQHGGEASLLFRALFGLWAFYIVRAEHRTAQALAKQLLDLAESQQDSALFVEAHWAVAASAFALGEISTAQTHFTQSIARYDPAEHHSLAFLYGYDPKMSSQTVGAWALWILGYPEQALMHSQDAITFAQTLSHPFSLAYAVGHAARLHQFRRESLAIQERTQTAMALSTEQGFRFYLTQGAIFLGVVSIEQGQGQEGIEQIQQGVAAFRATGAELYRPYFLGLLAEAYGKVAQAGEGLALLTEALAVVERTDERFYEAELWRIKGELTLAQENQKSTLNSQKARREIGPHPLVPSPQAEAEACFLKAIAIARQQQAKSLELRAVMSLARLCQRQITAHGSRNMQHVSGTTLIEVCQMLAEVYSWFTEGFDTQDLREAKVLLTELSHCSIE
ncbi:MAG: AAA family ATPase [Candidatus Binatia bacterium]